VPRVDIRQVVCGIIFIIRNGLRWRDAPKAYGPHKTLYNRFIRWSRIDVFDRIPAVLAAEGSLPGKPMIDTPILIDIHPTSRFRSWNCRFGRIPRHRGRWTDGGALACQSSWIVGEAPVRHRLDIDNRDHPIDGQARANGWPNSCGGSCGF
jgi:transposase